MTSVPVDAARRALVFEPGSDGHHLEWLTHLVRRAGRYDGWDRLFLAVAPPLEPPLAKSVPPVLRDRIEVLALTPREVALCRHRSLAVGAFAQWWLMRRYLVRTGADAGHFLFFDHVTLPLAFGLGAGGRELGGILFRPSVHYGELGPYGPSRGERLRDRRKDLLYRLTLRNPAVRAVLSLDEHFPAYAARRYKAGEKVVTLFDPAHPLEEATQADRKLADQVPKDRVLFSLFGYLTERKGVLTVLDALDRLPARIRRRVAVMLAGRIEAPLRPAVDARVAHLGQARPDLWLHVEDRRISMGELSDLARRSDVVLAPYHRFVGSSGVVLWAAQAGRPLLTQDMGLVGRLVRDHALGLAADVSSPEALALAIEQMVQQGSDRFFDRDSARRFVEQHTPDLFASGIFASLGLVETRDHVAAA